MAKARRVAKISANQQTARAWRGGAPRVGADAEHFRTEILPLIQGLSLREMSDATGVSNTWWSQVKRGLRVPQERHWPVLVGLAVIRSRPGPIGGEPTDLGETSPKWRY
jgi:hypothetical protein